MSACVMRVLRLMKAILSFGCAVCVALVMTESVFAADLVLKTKRAPPIYDWTGLYVGSHLGYGWGRSNWTEQPDGISDSVSLAKPFDAFQNTGSFFAGVKAGYDYMFANRFVAGAVVDVSAPSFPNHDGISIGGMSLFTSPSLGPQTYSETMLIFGTARGRIGYALGNWLLYATCGYAWTYNQSAVNQLGSGPTDSPFLWRFGWVAGGGAEFPIAPHWTASLEYLFTRYGHTGVLFPNAGQGYDSDFSLQTLRVGLNYRFGNMTGTAPVKAPTALDPDVVNFHGQATFSAQGYPAFRSPYEGTNSLPGVARPREIADATLYAGLRLWQGAEFWFVPEIDVGFGIGDTHGVAGFTSAEAYKQGANYPYARIHRAFVRQIIDLGGKSEKVDTDISRFAGTQTENRLVLTAGKFAVVDIFDTNKYANNPKLDFLNWSHVNTGTFDYAADGWGYTYGAAAEWYQGRWTLRGGFFDLSKTPTGGVSPDGIDLDSSFHQFQLVGEIEERHELWGQPGKLKITGFLSRGRAGDFADAIAIAQLTGQPADINAVRVYRSRPGVSLNLEQQVSQYLGVFARAGWADGNVEPWDFTDIDRTVSGGFSLSGTQWARPNDTVGVAATVNRKLIPGHAATLGDCHGKAQTRCNAGPRSRKGGGFLRRCLWPQACEKGRGANRKRHFTLGRCHESHVAAFPRRNQRRQGWARMGGIASLRIRGRKRERYRARD